MSYVICAIETVLWRLYEYFFGGPKVLLHGKNFLVINKSYDLKINSNDSKEYTLQTYLRNKFPNYVNSKLKHQFYFVHRLDYATSGLICIPLNIVACRLAANMFMTRRTRKYYVALVRGIQSQELMLYEDGIVPEQKTNRDGAVVVGQVQSAKTLSMVLETGHFQGFACTKLLVRPITGRHHQIRMHMSHVGHTIVGDYTYSNRKDIEPMRMYLHAIRLVIPNELEFLDVRTPDPFTGWMLDSWRTVETYNKLDAMAYRKIDLFELAQVQS